MKRHTEFFVTFWSPGSFFAEDWTQPVETDDPRAVVWPERAYCFTMHRREVIEKDGKRFLAPAEQIGPRYYHPDSLVATVDQVRVGHPDSILLRNMEGNGWNAVVYSRWGNWPQPFDAAKDEVLS